MFNKVQQISEQPPILLCFLCIYRIKPTRYVINKLHSKYLSAIFYHQSISWIYDQHINNPHRIHLIHHRFYSMFFFQLYYIKKTACDIRACSPCVPRACTDKAHTKMSQWENRGGKLQRQGKTTRKNKCECTGENHWFTQIKHYLGQVCTHSKTAW